MTSTGRGVAAGSILLVALAIVLDYPELFAIGLAGVALALVGYLQSRVHQEVTVTRSVTPSEVVEGSRATASLVITNQGRRRASHLTARDRIGGQVIELGVPSLRSGESHEGNYPLPTRRRGRFTVGPLEVGSTDPAGLFENFHTRAALEPLVVYPRTREVTPIPTGSSQDIDGPTPSDHQQGGIEFHSLRDYEPGDDLRLVHWRSMARTGRLMVRHNVVASEPRVTLLLDTRSASYGGDDFDEAVRFAASWCQTTVRAGYPLELRTTGGLLVEPRSLRRTAEFMEALTDVETSDDDPGLVCLRALSGTAPGSSIGIVTGSPSDDALFTLFESRRRFDLVSAARLQPMVSVRRPHPGVLMVSGPTCDALAGAWDRAVGG